MTDPGNDADTRPADPARVPPGSLSFPELASSGDRERHALRLDAMAWAFPAPVLVRDEREIVSRPRWADRLEPFPHQIANLLTYSRRAPAMLIADDVGLGKTISAGLIVSELFARGHARRALVLCPDLLLPQWKEELEEKFGIGAAYGAGPTLERALASGAEAVVTTYQSAHSHMESIRAAGLDMLVLDEAHKLRNLHGSDSPPQFAVALQSAIRDRAFAHVLMLTATPVHNSLWDIYSLADLLATARGIPNPLGDPGAFVERFVADEPTRATRLREEGRDELRRRLAGFMVRTRRGDCDLEIPEREVVIERAPSKQPEVRQVGLMQNMLSTLTFDALTQSSVAQAMMSSPDALIEQLENMANGRRELGSYVHGVRTMHQSPYIPGKLAALDTLVHRISSENSEHWRIVIFTSRVATQDAIGRHLRSRGVEVGMIRAGKRKDNQRALQRFGAEPPGVRVLVSTDAGAEGLNLQVCDTVINYDLPWNPTAIEQRIGRVQRLASQHETVRVINLVVAGSVEDRVVARLCDRLHGVSHSLGDIESILQAAGDELADVDGFQRCLRRLVVAAMRGHRVEEQLARVLSDIDRGRAAFDSEQAAVETLLGRLDGAHGRDTDAPSLARLRPAAGVESVHARRAAAGGPDHGGPDDAPSAAALAELVGGGGALVTDTGEGDEAAWKRAVVAWMSRVEGAEVLGVARLGSRRHFQGVVTCRAGAAVADDRLDKLVGVQIRPAGHGVVSAGQGSTVEQEPTPTAELLGAFEAELSRAVGEDPDIGAFCRHYRARLDEQLGFGDAERVLRERYEPRISASVAALEGARYSVVDVDASFELDGHGPFRARFELVGPTGQVLEAPALETCDHTGRRAPAPCFERCAVSGKRVLRHLLAESERSGRRVLPECIRTCDVSGRRLVVDETTPLDTDRRVVDSTLVGHSETTQRCGLASEVVACEFTGARVLPDEAATSQVSQKRYRKDEEEASVASGRRGHRSEFVRSADPEGPIALDEAGRSSVSGRVGLEARLEASSLDPSRVGLPDEVVVCEATGARVLADEVGASEISGKRVALPELVASDISGRRALRSELVECAETGRLLFPDEAEACAVTGKVVDRRLLEASPLSGRRALPACFVESAATGERILETEAVRSEISGALLEPAAAVRSEKSGRVGLPGEEGTCAETGRTLLRDELGVCDVSGQTVDTDLLVASERSGRTVLERYAVRCDATGRTLVEDETAVSDVSGRRVDSELLERSARSGRRALGEEIVVCEASGARLLPDEAATCEVSGKRIDATLLVQSEISGRRAQASLVRRCDVTGASILQDEGEQSEVTGRWFRSDEREVSAASGRAGHRSEFVRAEDPEGPIAPDEVGRSVVSGRVCARERLCASEVDPSRAGLPDEVVVCEATGRRALADEVEASELSGKTVIRAELAASAVSGRRALRDEMVTCEAGGMLLFPDEAERCAVTGKLVDKRLLQTSAVSGKRALPECFVTCAVSGRPILESEAAKSDVSGSLFEPGLGARSEKSERIGMESESAPCVVTRKILLIDELGRCEVSRERVDRELLVTSALSGRTVLKRHAVRCESSGRTLAEDEVAPSDVSGRRVDESLLVVSGASGRRALPEEMVVCEASGARLLPDEVGVCAVSGRRVDRRLLVKTDISGRLALGTHVRTCEVTGKKGVEGEIERCAATGKDACADLLAGCSVTGRRMLRELLEEIPGTPRLFSRDHAAEAALRQAGAEPPLFRECRWHGEALPATETGRCALTGLDLIKSQLNEQSESVALRGLLAGRWQPTYPVSLDAEALGWLAARLREFGKISKYRGATSADGRLTFLAVETKGGLFGRRERAIGAVVELEPEPRLVAGPIVGQRREGAWNPMQGG